MAEPQDFPTSGDGSVTSVTWAEGGTAIEPGAGRKNTGASPGNVLASAEWNWLTQAGYRFGRASWARGVRSSDAFMGSWMPPTGAGVWSTDAVGVLEGFLSDSPTGVNSVAADVFLDPDDEGAVRLQVTVGKATPHTFPANRDTYVFAPIDVVTPPFVTETDLAYIDVPIGNPAPATPAGHVPVWRVETDGATIVDQEKLLFEFPILKDIGMESLGIGGNLSIAGELSVDGPADFEDTVMVDGVLTCGDDVSIAGELSVAQPVYFASELAVDGPVTCNGDLTIASSTTLTVGSSVTLAAANNTWVWGTSNANSWQIHGENTLGTDASSAQELHGNVSIGTNSSNNHTVSGDISAPDNAEFGTGESTTFVVNSTSTFNEGLTVGVASVQTTNGKLQYDGLNLFIGTGTAVNSIKGVRTNYTISDDTASAFDNLTGSSIGPISIAPDDWVFIKVEAKQLTTNNAVTCNLGIAATNGVDTVTVLNTGDPDAALSTLPPSTAINQTRINSIIVRWKPTNDVGVPANNNWTINARHGVSAGTVTSTNVYLQVWR